jgi:cytidine deaminase
MKKKTSKTSSTSLNTDLTDEEILNLSSEAKNAVKAAIAPYSGFKVGACLLASDGRTFKGSNIENPSLMLSVCAERTALFKALSEGASSFKALFIASDKPGYCFPCGACRQALIEFAPGIAIYLVSDTGIKKFTIEELLPYPFRKK